MTEANPDWRPLDSDEHAEQIEAILRLLDGGRKRVVEIGAGDGRICLPLMQAGHDVLAIDSDPGAVEQCRSHGIESRMLDVVATSTEFLFDGARVDAVLCVGNTFMLFHDPLVAEGLLRRIRDALEPDGVFVIDNFTAALWTDVHEGSWSEGVSEDGDMQLLWQKGENVFVLRQGDAVDPDDWTIRPEDRRHRLWSKGELTLLASGGGFRPPEEDPSGQLVVFRTV